MLTKTHPKPKAVLNKTLGLRRLVVAFPLQRRPSPPPPRHPGQPIPNPQLVLNKMWPRLPAAENHTVLNKTPTPDSRAAKPHAVLTKTQLNKTLGVRRLVVAFPLQRRPNPPPPRHPGQSTQNPSPVLNKTESTQPGPVLNKTRSADQPVPVLNKNDTRLRSPKPHPVLTKTQPARKPVPVLTKSTFSPKTAWC